MNELSILQQIAIWALPVIFAITWREAAQALVAFRLGDPTAYSEGRVTLNPTKHIDLIGTIVLPLSMIVFNAGFLFGWAKPIPINANNLHNPRRDSAYVACAGPVSSIIMAILWAIIMKIGLLFVETSSDPLMFLVYAGQAGLFINSALFILHLIPIPPLDGGRILLSVLPVHMALKFSRIEAYSPILLILLLLSGLLGKVLIPLMILMIGMIGALVGLQ